MLYDRQSAVSGPNADADTQECPPGTPETDQLLALVLLMLVVITYYSPTSPSFLTGYGPTIGKCPRSHNRLWARPAAMYCTSQTKGGRAGPYNGYMMIIRILRRDNHLEWPQKPKVLVDKGFPPVGWRWGVINQNWGKLYAVEHYVSSTSHAPGLPADGTAHSYTPLKRARQP
jgi:hypothetical protein